MKKLFIYLFVAITGLYIAGLSSCNKPDPEPEPEPEDTTKTVVTSKQGLVVIVKTMGSAKPTNSYASYAVLGRTKEDMFFTKYESKKLSDEGKQKPLLTSPANFTTLNWFVDTAYSIKNNLTWKGDKVGAIKMEVKTAGTYYYHIFDGGMNKAVGVVSIVKDQYDTIEVEVRPLGHLKVVTAQSGISGTELDSIEYRLYGLGNDTFLQVAKVKLSDINLQPFYRGATSTATNELGQNQTGIAFLMDINAGRKYNVYAYSSVHASKDGKQPNKEIRIQKNLLGQIRVNFID